MQTPPARLLGMPGCPLRNTTTPSWSQIFEKSRYHDVTDKSHGKPLTLNRFDLRKRADDTGLVGLNAITRHFEHGECVKRDVRSRLSVWGR